MEKKTAHNATSAARLLESTGELPEFSQAKKQAASPECKKAAKEAALSLIANPEADLPSLKNSLSEKYGVPFLKNSEILAHIPLSNLLLRRLLLKSPTRTLSGVSPIAVMPPPSPCGGSCIYCPKGKNAPQSYTGFEPTTMRAIESGYSAKKQVLSRIEQYESQGHPTDKCHLIVMGGNFLNSPDAKRVSFMKDAYGALNGKKSPSLPSAINANENAPHRAIGVTFETRPDYINEKNADSLLSMGGTQVELGVQALSDSVYEKASRGHTVADVARATALLRDCGFKICYHMMPGLFSTPEEDVSYFQRLFSDPSFRPDMLKIYPVLVLRGTKLYEMWEKGEFSPYETGEAAKVIADAIRFIPPYVRISRIQRDIPTPLIAAGVKNSNLRQIVECELIKTGARCRCIRCREIGSKAREGEEKTGSEKESEAGKSKKAGEGNAGNEKENASGKSKKAGAPEFSLNRLGYIASGGKEIFLSFEDEKKDMLAGFLRLRIPRAPHRSELEGSSVVRELHVYGQEASIGERSREKQQHQGLGGKLLADAEKITKKEYGLSKISVLSGPGARGYYRKLGYSLVGAYMQKKL